MYPQGYKAEGYLSLYLEYVDSEKLQAGSEKNVFFQLTLVSQIDESSKSVNKSKWCSRQLA